MTGPGIQSPLGAKPPPGSERVVAEINNRRALKVFGILFGVLVVLTAVILAVAFL